jgi:hypothetical protein
MRGKNTIGKGLITCGVATGSPVGDGLATARNRSCRGLQILVHASGLFYYAGMSSKTDDLLLRTLTRLNR